MAGVTFDRIRVQAALPGYVLGVPIGNGGSGAVIAARDRLRREVAVKVVPVGEGRESAAELEALALVRLRHPHIVEVYDFVPMEAAALIVMELLPGGDLRSRLRAKPTVRWSCAVALALADALEFAHGQDLLHRDVKPSNVLFTRDGQVKLIDFGIAAVVGRPADLAGTPGYMAPEQIQSSEPRPTLDVYGLSVSVYEMLTGSLPVEQRSRSRQDTTPPLPAYLPVEVGQVMLRALAFDPAERQPTARAFALDLAAAARTAFGPGWLAQAEIAVELDPEIRETAGGGSDSARQPSSDTETTDPRVAFADRLQALKQAVGLSARQLAQASALTPPRRPGAGPVHLRRGTIAGMISRTRPTLPKLVNVEVFVDTCLRVAQEAGVALPGDLGNRQAWDEAYRRLHEEVVRPLAARSGADQVPVTGHGWLGDLDDDERTLVAPPQQTGGPGAWLDPDAPLGALADRFVEARRLPSSGTGRLFIVTPDGGEEQLLKIHPVGSEASQEELKRSRKIRSNRHLVEVHEFGFEAGQFWELQEFVRGVSLADVIRDHGLPTRTVTRIAEQVASAVIALHDNELAHAEIVAENIILRGWDGTDSLSPLGEVDAVLIGWLGHTAIQQTYFLPGAGWRLVDMDQTDRLYDWRMLGETVFRALGQTYLGQDLDTVTVAEGRRARRPPDLAAVDDERLRLLCRGLLPFDAHLGWQTAEVSRWLAGESPSVPGGDDESGGPAAIRPGSVPGPEQAEAQPVAEPDAAGGGADGDPSEGWDFYVSHVAADSDWAAWAGWQLEQAGYRVRVQAWDFVAGNRWERMVQEAVRGATHTIVLLSDGYLASAAARAEWELVFGTDLSGERRRLVPVRIEDCEPAGFLAGLISIDLFGLPEDDARRVLVERVQATVAGSARPVSPPEFPGTPAPVFPPSEPVPRAAAGSGPRRPARTIPPLADLPDLPDSYVPRAEDVASVRDLLLAEAPASVVAILGPAESGKTTLAVALVHDATVRAAFPGGIVWIPGGPDLDLAALTRAVLAAFGDTGPVNDKADGERRLGRLLAGAACLLVVDDSWVLGLDTLPIAAPTRILVTAWLSVALPADRAEYAIAGNLAGAGGDPDPSAREMTFRRRLIDGGRLPGAAAVHAEIAQILTDVQGDATSRLEAEFGFVLDDGLRKILWADDERRGWLLGIWAALATGNDFALDAPAIELRTPDEPDEPGPQRRTDERVQSDVGPPDKVAQRPVEERLLRLLGSLFTIGPDQEDDLLLQLRSPAAGSRFGHDACFDAVAAGQIDVRCHVQISNTGEPLALRDVAGRLAEIEERAGGEIDQFVVISARGEPTDELRARARTWNESHRHPFDVLIWSPDQGVRDFFALDAPVYEAVYAEPWPGQPGPRDQVLGRLGAKLTRAVRLPAVWRDYLRADAPHCIGHEDRDRFRELLDEFVEPKAADERGTSLGRTLDAEVRDWLGKRHPEAGSLLLLAEFGEGKSFFTYLLSRRLSAEALRDPETGWIPLRLALKELRGVRDARELLERRLAEIGVSVADWWELCDRYQTLVILDGFDEMSVRLDPASLRDNINALADCHELFSRSKLLITSRTQFFEGQRDQQRFLDRVGGPRILRVAHAARDQVVEHLASYARRVDAEEKLARLAHLYDPIGVARKPLFLEMIKEALPELPDDHFDEVVLYRTYVERSIRRKIEYLADDQAELTRAETIENLQAILEEIATRLYLEEKAHIELRSLRLPNGELAEQLWRMSDGAVALLASDASDDARARIGIRSLLKPVQGTGIDPDRWPVDFFHRSMREYFFARAILRALRDDAAARMLAAAPLQPEVMDFVRLLIEAEPDRQPFLARLTGLARGAVRLGAPSSCGGNAISLLFALQRSLPRVDWSGLDLDNAYLAGADLRGMNFSGSSLRLANLDNADLREADLRNADLAGVRLEETARVLALSQTSPTGGTSAVYAFYSDRKVRRWRLDVRGRLDVRTFLPDLPKEIHGVATGPFGDLVVLSSGQLEIYLLIDGDFVLASQFRPRMDLRGLRGSGADLLLSLERPDGHRILRYSPAVRSSATSLAAKGTGGGAFLDAGSTAVVGWGDGRLAFARRAADGAAQQVTVLPFERITGFDVTPAQDGRLGLLAVGHADGTVEVWRIDPWAAATPVELVWSRRRHRAAVTAILFRGPRYLVSGSADRSLSVFTLDDRAQPSDPRDLALTLQCAGAQIEGVTGERERRLLQAARAQVAP